MVCPIHFGRYNIRNGWNRGLESVLRGMAQENVNLRVFQETKVTGGIYMQEYSGYRVEASDVPSRHSGGVAVFYCTEEHFSLEALRLYSTNVVILQLASVGQQWHIVGCYLSSDNALKIEDVVASISQRPRDAALLVVRYLTPTW